MTPTDIKSQWRESWKSAPVVNAHLVDDPTIRQPGFTLPRQQWSLLNRFRTDQGHCGACRKTLICAPDRTLLLLLLCVLLSFLLNCSSTCLQALVPWRSWRSRLHWRSRGSWQCACVSAENATRSLHVMAAPPCITDSRHVISHNCYIAYI